MTARSNASSPSSPAARRAGRARTRQRRRPSTRVLADLQLLGAGRRPPVDRARLVAVDVVAQAVEVARPEPLGQRQQVAAEHALAERRHVEQVGARRHEHLLTPATVADGAGQAEDVVAHGRQRADGQHAAALGRDPVAGADLGVGAERRRRPSAPCGSRRPARRARTPGEPAAADRCDEHLDPADVAGGEHRRADPPLDRDARPAHGDEHQRDDGASADRGADDEELEDPEQPARRRRRTAAATSTIQPWRVRLRAHAGPPAQRGGRDGHVGEDLADGVDGIEAGAAVGAQQQPVAERRDGHRLDVVGRGVAPARGRRRGRGRPRRAAAWPAATGRARSPGGGGWPRRCRRGRPSAASARNTARTASIIVHHLAGRHDRGQLRQRLDRRRGRRGSTSRRPGPGSRARCAAGSGRAGSRAAGTCPPGRPGSAWRSP